MIYCTWKWLYTDGVEILSAEKGITTRQTRTEETFKVAAVNNRSMTGATTISIKQTVGTQSCTVFINASSTETLFA